MWLTASNSWLIVKKAALAFIEDDAPQMGAALAFYSTLSLAPLVVISLSIAAVFVESKDAEAELMARVMPFVGSEGGEAIKGLLKQSRQPLSLTLATAFSLLTLLIGASGVFGQLQSAMNAIWNVSHLQTGSYLGMARGRLQSLAMVLVASMLLLGSLVLSTVEKFIQQQAGDWLNGGESWRPLIGEIVVLLVTVLLFAMVFKFVPDARVAWRDVWFGALGTALLFWIGKSLIGLYLAKAAPASAYGAAGSLVALLVWIYYSSQIFFFGAELTYAFSQHRRKGGEVK
jgi:membrane protein